MHRLRQFGSHLMCDIRSSVTDVAIHLPHYTDMLVAVEQCIFVVPPSRTSTRAVGRLVRLQTGVRQDHDQSLGVLVTGGDRNMLFCDESGELWRR